ncbi:MAG TPA: diacylglycerol kinase family protein [Nitrosospira sp.]|nr:diacylglycerol kinase family protein [Nitrosospira sp.]
MPFIVDAPGPPLFIIVNAESGHNDIATVCQTIETMLKQAGRRYKLIVVDDPAKLEQTAQDASEQACKCQGAVVVAGGDGSINTVAQVTFRTGCPLGVIPQGTFNYFGREHGISSDTTEAVRALLSSRPQAVQVGVVNDRLFLVNASLGLYPKLLEDREAFKQQYGRNRLVALVSGLITLLGQRGQLRITLRLQGKDHEIRTPTLFVGNNRLQLKQIGISLENNIGSGELAAIALRPVGTFAMLWLLVRSAFGELGEAHDVINFSFEHMIIRPTRDRYRKRRVKVATDGEIARMDMPLEFRVSPHPLLLLKPDTVVASPDSATGSNA